MWNIDPKTKNFEENELPKGISEGKNNVGKQSYTGPCPPLGTHRYFFKLYALDIVLNLSLNTTKNDLEKEIEGHIIAKNELVGLYSRK